MLAGDRRNKILKAIEEKESVSIKELSEFFEVSEMTIRRDLDELSHQRLVERIHGGATIIERAKIELSYKVRQQKQIEAKTIIAKHAAGLISNGETIALDNSSTSLQVARFLNDKRDLTIITNTYHIFQTLNRVEGITILFTGGIYRETTGSLVGPFVNKMLDELHIDKVFISARGISPDKGITDPNIQEIEVKRAMVEAGKETYLLIDHSKFGDVAFCSIIPLERLKAVITDRDPPPGFEEIENRVNLVIAK